MAFCYGNGNNVFYASLISKTAVPANVQEYAVVSMELSAKICRYDTPEAGFWIYEPSGSGIRQNAGSYKGGRYRNDEQHFGMGSSYGKPGIKSMCVKWKCCGRNCKSRL